MKIQIQLSEEDIKSLIQLRVATKLGEVNNQEIIPPMIKVSFTTGGYGEISATCDLEIE